MPELEPEPEPEERYLPPPKEVVMATPSDVPVAAVDFPASG